MPRLSRPPPDRTRTSDLLLEILRQDPRDRVTVGDLIDRMGDRAFGIMILLCTLPNCVPAPPGVSTVTGLPIILFSLQIIFGARRPWLPEFLRRRDFGREDFLRILSKADPWMKRFERLCRPRLTAFVYGPAERFAGVVLLILSCILILPIFLGNFPPAVAIAVIAIALMEHDGAAILIGHVGAVIATAVAVASVLAQLVIAVEALELIFGVDVGWPT